MTAPPLTPDIATAIRATWPKAIHKTYNETPGHFTHCACQHGPTGACDRGRHDLCGRANPLRACETTITRTNFTVTHLPEPYQHPTDTNAIGPRHTTVAQVWLADRVCRWQCPCTCHTTTPAAPPPPTTTPTPRPRTPRQPRRAQAGAGQLDILDLIGADQ